MKKKFLGLAVIALSLVSANSFAQAPNKDKTCTDKSCQTTQQCKPSKDKKAPCPFDGLNLTDAQKAKVKELGEKRQAARAKMKKDKKAEKQRMDSAQFARRNEVMKIYLDELKGVLTPEQYVMFLENSYINANGRPGKGFGHQGKDFKSNHPSKDGKRNHARRDGKGMKLQPITATANN
ncbi:MAG: hypothetical protein NC453_08665 [Muribaculum sp.]|nr:hypothetical protein [Muribaculum sp.]